MSAEETLVRLIVDDRQILLDLPESERDHVQSQIRRRRRFYEDDLLEHMRTVVQPGNVVVDAGAYVGNHTLFLSRVCSARVVAFEPNPESCAVLRRNVALNDAHESIVVHPFALGASEARGALLTPSRSNLGDTRIVDDPRGPVTIVALDAIDLPGPVAAMKVDVQGMELAVLSGARVTIERDRPCIYVEVHTAAALAAVASMLAEWSYVPRAQFGTSPTVLFVPVGRAPYDTDLQLAMAQHRILSVMTSQGGRLASLVQRGPATTDEEDEGPEHLDITTNLAGALESLRSDVCHLGLRLERLRATTESDRAAVAQALRLLEELAKRAETDSVTHARSAELIERAYDRLLEQLTEGAETFHAILAQSADRIEGAHDRLLDRLADRAESARLPAAEAVDRIDRAIHEVGKSVDQRALVASLAMLESATKRLEAELFSLRGHIDGRRKSLLERTQDPASRRHSMLTDRSPRAWHRKLRKFVQTPRKFLTDSAYPALRRSGDLLDTAAEWWRK